MISIFIKISKVFFLLVSLLFFIESFYYGFLGIDIFGSYFLLFIYTLIHELGHVIGCLICKTKIHYIEVFGFKFSNKITINDRLALYGKVNFDKTPKRKIIYLLGPVVTTIITVIISILYCFEMISIVYYIVTILFNIIVFLPFKGSDLRKIYEKGK